MIEHPRVLGALRVSVTSDDSTSAEKQKDGVSHWANGPAINGVIVGWAVDLDVSGGLHPFRRPELGPWFNERADEWDVIAVWKLDRLTRRSAHFSELHEWCIANSKVIVSVTEGIDMSTPMGKMFAQIIAAFAEGELDTIRARALSGSLARLQKGVWVGGVLPFGYQFQRLEGGGKVLVQESEYAKLAVEMIDRLKGDWSSYKIALDYNKRGVLTWRDRLRVLQDQEPRGIQWTSNTVLACVKNPTIGGYYTYKGTLVEDDEGNPIPITSEPIMPYTEWADFVAGLETNKRAMRAIPSRSMLGGVSVCGGCQSRMSSSRKYRAGAARDYHYYACNAIQTGMCDKPARVRRDDLDNVINQVLVDAIGEFPVVEKAVNRISEIKVEHATAKARLARLEADFLAGRYDGDGQEESYWRMHAPLSSKVSSLTNSIASAEAAPAYIDTGRIYRDVWSEMDDEQKRVFLQRHEIEISILPADADSPGKVQVRVPNMPLLAERAGLKLPKQISWPVWEMTENLPGRRRRGQG
ncbi:recombinase family protein [Embleya sp. NBC_00888]|uniref:recombinase family protein n=1 Tax=Embleya sp. NBC_00888 TaxID=2975960 RepID=UPI003868A8BA|nr:recombinase family protein [Embleya sp. NBC_00888]